MKGSLRKRGKVWYTTFDLPRTSDQPRRQKSVRLGEMSKAEAQRREREVLAEFGDTPHVDDSTRTVGDLLDAWLKYVEPTSKAQVISPNTYVRYASIVRLHLKPHLGDVALNRLTPGAIAEAYTVVRGKGLSGRSCLHVHRVLHTAFQYGTETLLWLKENPAASVKAPKVAKRVPHIDGSVIPALLDLTRETPFECPIALTATTGVRRGELLALRWSTSIDFERKRLVVSESLEETKMFGLRFKSPKSGNVRVIPIADGMIPVLLAHRAKQNAEKLRRGRHYQDNDLVFCNPDGSPWPPDTLTKQFAELAKNLGVKGFRFHDLRHAFATLTLKNGTPVKEVSTLLGHSTESITLSTYAHVVEGVAREAVNALADDLMPKRKGTSAA